MFLKIHLSPRKKLQNEHIVLFLIRNLFFLILSLIRNYYFLKNDKFFEILKTLKMETLRSRSLGKFLSLTENEELPYPINEDIEEARKCLNQDDKFYCFLKLGMFQKAKEFITNETEKLVYRFYITDQLPHLSFPEIVNIINWEKINGGIRIKNQILIYLFNNDRFNDLTNDQIRILKLFELAMKLKLYEKAKNFITQEWQEQFYNIIVHDIPIHLDREQLTNFFIISYEYNIADFFIKYNFGDFIRSLDDEEEENDIIHGMVFKYTNIDNVELFHQLYPIFEEIIGDSIQSDLLYQVFDHRDYQLFEKLIQLPELQVENDDLIKAIVLSGPINNKYLYLIDKYAPQMKKPTQYYMNNLIDLYLLGQFSIDYIDKFLKLGFIIDIDHFMEKCFYILSTFDPHSSHYMRYGKKHIKKQLEYVERLNNIAKRIFETRPEFIPNIINFKPFFLIGLYYAEKFEDYRMINLLRENGFNLKEGLQVLIEENQRPFLH